MSPTVTGNPTPTGLPMASLDRTAMRAEVMGLTADGVADASLPQNAVAAGANVTAEFATLISGFRHKKSDMPQSPATIKDNLFPHAERYAREGHHDLAAKVYEEAIRQCQFELRSISYCWFENKLRGYTPGELSYLKFKMELHEKAAESALKNANRYWSLEHLTAALKIAKKKVNDLFAVARISEQIGSIYSLDNDNRLEALNAYRTAASAWGRATQNTSDTVSSLLRSAQLHAALGHVAANLHQNGEAVDAFMTSAKHFAKLSHKVAGLESPNQSALFDFAFRESGMIFCALQLSNSTDERDLNLTMASLNAVAKHVDDSAEMKERRHTLSAQYENLAKIAVKAKQRTIANTAFQEALRLDKDLKTLIAYGENAAHMINYATMDIREGYYAEAMSVFKEALKHTDSDPLKAKLHFYIAKLARQYEDFSQAQMHYLDIEALPNIDSSMFNGAQLLRYLITFQGAEMPAPEKIVTKNETAKKMALDPQFITAAIDIDNGIFGSNDVGGLNGMLGRAQFFMERAVWVNKEVFQWRAVWVMRHFESGISRGKGKYHRTTLEALKALEKAGYINDASAVMARVRDKTKHGWSEG